MKKYLIIAICLFGLSPIVKAQMININYQISMPLNKVKDFTDKASFRGLNIEYHQFLSERFSIGGGIGWNVFYQDKNNISADFKFQGNDNLYKITGRQYRYLNTVPILAMGRYYFTDSDTRIRPYCGLGLGMSWTERRLEVGQFASTISRWQFAMSPEIGMYIPLNDQIAFNVGAKYNYATKAANGRVPEIQSFSFNLGITLLGMK